MPVSCLKRCFSFAAAVALTVSCVCVQAHAVSTSASAAILMDADSGRVLYAYNETARMRIASTTKILTALVALEQGDLAQMITVSARAAAAEGSSMYLKAGEKLSLETLLYGLMLCSGNDAAIAVAEGVSGSVEAFVKQMNARAAAIGMSGSSFANPNGLDDERHYSTALDMARLARAALENETLIKIASTRNVTIGGRSMHNHNKLLSYMEDCIGLKTGYTRAAGRTLVSCAERNGQRLIAVTLQDGNDWADHQALYAYGFAAFPSQQAAAVGRQMGEVPVLGGLYARVPVVAQQNFSWPVGEGETLQVRCETAAAVAAPVLAGTPAGTLVVSVDGTEEVGRVRLVYGASVLPALPEPIRAFAPYRDELLDP